MPNSLLKAARLRTLPLAVSGIIIGCAWAWMNGQFELPLLIFGLSTAILLQVLSNFANDYGDFIKGTDNSAGRTDRVLANGDMSLPKMKNTIIITSILSLISGILLLYFVIDSSKFIYFLILGLIAIASAIFYTVGKRAYGYFGFGDVFVFVFFGIVSVYGIYFLHDGMKVNYYTLISSAGVGLLCTAILNINNIRDITTDTLAGKITIPVKLGYKKAMIYHRILVIGGLLLHITATILFSRSKSNNLDNAEIGLIIGIFLPIVLLCAQHLGEMRKIDETDRLAYNKQLKKLSLTIFLAALIFLCYGFIQL